MAIDVLRATTVMSVATSNGALCIIPVKEPAEAQRAKASIEGPVLLGGERNADKIEGFDLDNSPLSYTRQAVEGRTIVMTTTNGTLAIANSRSASRVFVASFLNADAVAEAIADEPTDVYIVCAGTAGEFTIEDALCGGYLAQLLTDKWQCEVNDFALAMMSLYKSAGGNVRHILEQGEHYARLVRKGYAADVEVCTNRSQRLPALYFDGFAVRQHTKMQ